MRILGISGSLRKDSHNTALLRAAAELLPPGVELELFDGLRDDPALRRRRGRARAPAPRECSALKDAIERADAVLISTPEYNHSIPGVLKNALDWASRPVADNVLRGKPAAVIGASTGLFGAVWAQAEVRKVLAAIGAEVVDRELPVMQAHAQFDEYGNLREEDLRGQLAEHVTALVRGRAREGRRLGVPKAARPNGTPRRSNGRRGGSPGRRPNVLRRPRSGSRGREPGPPDAGPPRGRARCARRRARCARARRRPRGGSRARRPAR